MLYLKGQSNEIFTSDFFTDGLLPSLLLSIYFSNLASNSRRYSRFLIDSMLLLTAESQYSLFCLIRRVVTLRFIIAGRIVRIIRINSRLSFNTQSRYSPYCLLRKVPTPRIVYSWESLLTAESYFKILWRTPPSFRGTMKQKMNYTCRALLTKNIF
jgi:hypothetical protein